MNVCNGPIWKGWVQILVLDLITFPNNHHTLQKQEAADKHLLEEKLKGKTFDTLQKCQIDYHFLHILRSKMAYTFFLHYQSTYMEE